METGAVRELWKIALMDVGVAVVAGFSAAFAVTFLFGLFPQVRELVLGLLGSGGR